MFVPILMLAFSSTWIIESLTGVFLLDVTTTFFGSPTPTSIAATAQLVAISSVVSVIFGFMLGALSVRFNHKKLLLIGVFGVALGTAGCFLAPNFSFMQVFFPIEGIGTATVSAMSFALVGRFLPLNRRPKAIGWILAGSPIAGLAGALVIYLFFSGAGSWQSYLLWFALPVSLISLAAVVFVVPSAPQEPKTTGREYFSSFKHVFLKKSAAACLVGTMFRMAALTWATIYFATFIRTQFNLSLSIAALIVLVGTAISVLADVIGGYFVNRIGRKRQLVSTLVISSIALVAVAFVPDLWVVLILSWVGGFIFGAGFPAGTSLHLEQVPEFRGTMMSMTNVFATLGMGLGAAVGGVALVLTGWTGLILTFASMQLIAAAIFFFLTKDPCRTPGATKANGI